MSDDIHTTRRCPHGKLFDDYCEPCEVEEAKTALMRALSEWRDAGAPVEDVISALQEWLGRALPQEPAK